MAEGEQGTEAPGAQRPLDGIQSCQDLQFELDAQRQVNSDIVAQLQDLKGLYDVARAQLHEERRLHELTSSKLAAAAEAAAELEHQSSRADVAELTEHCRRLDNRLQEEHAHCRALTDKEAFLNDQIDSNKEEIQKYKEHVKQLRNNAQLLQQSLDEKTQMLFEYEARLDNAPNNRSKSKSGSACESSSGPSTRQGTSSSTAGAGMVPLSQVKMIEQTLTLVRNELRKALGEKEALKQSQDELQTEIAALKEELDVVKTERDALAQDRDRLELQNSFDASQHASPKSQDVDRVEADKPSLAFEGSETKESNESARASAQEEVGGQRVPSPQHVIPPYLHPSRPKADMVEEQYRLLQAKYGRLSAVLEKEQLRREALEEHVLSLKRAGQNEECLQCAERERDRERSKEEAEMSVLDAKAAVLATRADCGRLRADLNHSLECLRAAEESKILLERALLDQHQRCQRQHEQIQILQAEDQFQKLQLRIQTLKGQTSNETPVQDLSIKREGAALRVWSPASAQGNSTKTKRMACSRRSSEGRAEEHSKSRVDFALRNAGSAVQSPGSEDLRDSNSMLLTSPPTPLYTSTGLSMQQAQRMRLSPSPAPNTGNTIFYTTASPAVRKSEMGTRANSSTRHSRLSADPTIPSLTLPEEMKDHPDGVNKAGWPAQKPLRESISASISKARQSSLPPRARTSGESSPCGGDEGEEGSGVGQAKGDAAFKDTETSLLSQRVSGGGQGAGAISEHSVSALHVSNPSNNTPSLDTPAPAQHQHPRVVTSPTANMGVLTRSINPNGPMDFRAPSESLEWHFP